VAGQAFTSVWAILIGLGLTGCVLAPRGVKEERGKLQAAGQRYEPQAEERGLPELVGPVTWQDVLQRAFLANGDLEAAYFEWKAALARVDAAAAWPNTKVQLGFEYMFSRENMKAWDRTTLSTGLDPTMMLQWPGKASRAGKVALAGARAAGSRFEAAKFELQRKVLTAWADYVLMAQRVRIQHDQTELLRMLVTTGAERLGTGGAQPDLVRAQTEYEMAGNELAAMQSQLRGQRAMLNGMLSRPPDAALIPAATEGGEAMRPVPSDDRLIAAGVDRNPEMAALAQQVAGRANALELARMAYIPDFAPQFSATGSISQAVGAMVNLPTNLVEIRASIQEARAMLGASQAMARQARSDRAASFVATLAALRDSERQARFFSDEILPLAEQLVQSDTEGYAVGSVAFTEMIEDRRTLLDARLSVAEAQAAREQRRAELEALAGMDVETLVGPAPNGQAAGSNDEVSEK